MATLNQCPYCQKQLKSQRGVTQHINQSPSCLQEQQKQISLVTSLVNAQGEEPSQLRQSKRLQVDDTEVPGAVRFASRKAPPEVPDQDDANVDWAPDDASKEVDIQKERAPARKQYLSSDSDSTSSNQSSTTDASKSAATVPPNRELLKQFRQYCDEHHDNYLALSKEDKSSIRLMHVLRRKAPLHVYKHVLEWHLKESGKLRRHEKLKDAESYYQRGTLMKRLIPRYNLSAMLPKEKKVKLPSSKAVVSIPIRDAGDCIVSLLTDPRFRDSDYLFFDDNPLAPPPKNITYLADLNTGDAYRRTYEKMITHDRQVLLPVIIYIDGATTGQFTDLPVTAVKIALGIHNREARDRTYAWRELGFIPVVRKDPARGKRIFQETGHLESQDVIVLEGEGDPSEGEHDTEEDDEGSEDGAVKAQDFHTMLSAILESFVKLQQTGFIWDLVYKGKVYRDIEFVIFVPFVKCDTEEADLLCGKYLVRNQNISHICRYCHCPTANADDPRAKYPLKTQPEIQKLIEKGDLDRLQAISQQNIQNAWYDVTFHQANKCGIHGACPSEKLHAIQLGIFKYLRDIFFDRMGKTSQLAESINGLATMYGKLLTRQSERDLPNTNFAKGIQKGKLMARDYRGVLLIMAAVLRSTKGRELLFKRKKLGGMNGLRDWTLLVETMLEWETYLCEKKMERKDVKRLAKKHRFLMYIMRSVAKRSSGMGLKIMKFHAIVHLLTDILLYGVPTEFDTGSNESHHKDSKHAARLTQRKESTFNYQTAKRLAEFLCIDLAMMEAEHEIGVWEYFEASLDAFMEVDSDPSEALHDTDMEEASEDSEVDDSNQEASATQSDTTNSTEREASSSEESEDIQIRTGGSRIKIYYDDDMQKNRFGFISRSKTIHNGVWVQQVVDWLFVLQQKVVDFIPGQFLPVLTEHTRGDMTFYGHPNYRSSGPWKDWVEIQWGAGWGILPSHIWCFIHLQNMPIGNQKIKYGGITLTDGVFAVVEVGNYSEDDEAATASDLFTPLELDVEGLDADGAVVGRKFYLANTDAIVGPCCVVPDIGGANNAYFQVKARREWSKLFVQWLRDPHEREQYSDDEEEEAE